MIISFYVIIKIDLLLRFGKYVSVLYIILGQITQVQVWKWKIFRYEYYLSTNRVVHILYIIMEYRVENQVLDNNNIVLYLLQVGYSKCIYTLQVLVCYRRATIFTRRGRVSQQIRGYFRIKLSELYFTKPDTVHRINKINKF